MNLTRRDTLKYSAGAAAAAMAPLPLAANTPETLAPSETFDEALAAFTGGADMTEGGVDIIAPDIAENGYIVPIEVSADGASAIVLFAPKNPLLRVVTFNFGPLSAVSSAKTRIRLAASQELVAVAKMPDGSFRTSKRAIEVTIGGCG